MTVVACRLSEIVVDSRDPEALAAWWAEVLGYRVLGRDEDGAVEIGPEAGFGGPVPTLVFTPVGEYETAKSRLHVDLNATDRDQDAELQRLLDLGATPADVGQTGEESWHVLADPSPEPRVHLDLNATDRDQDAELQRLLDLGATPADVGQTGEESWHVLADPEGNPFCLLRRRLDPL